MDTTKKIDMKAIFFDEISAIDDQFNDKLQKGELTCTHCGSNVQQVGLYSVSINNGKVSYCCTNSHCINQVRKSQGS